MLTSLAVSACFFPPRHFSFRHLRVHSAMHAREATTVTERNDPRWKGDKNKAKQRSSIRKGIPDSTRRRTAAWITSDGARTTGKIEAAAVSLKGRQAVSPFREENQGSPVYDRIDLEDRFKIPPEIRVEKCDRNSHVAWKLQCGSPLGVTSGEWTKTVNGRGRLWSAGWGGEGGYKVGWGFKKSGKN